MSTPRRVFGYARVSSEQQALGSSLKDQQVSISAYAKSRGLVVTRFFVESESGGRKSIEKREQIQALMREVKRGDLVICDKLDRWSRDPEFTYGSVRKILECGAAFYAVSDRCDPGTSEGDSTLGFRILFAREEHKRIRERTVGTRNILRDQGYYIEGTPPFGYRRAKPKGYKGVEKNVLVIVPENADLVRRMFRLSVGGKSLNQIAAALGVHKDRVHDCMRNRHYLGELKNSRGEWIKGPHEALVGADLFKRAGEAMANRKLGGPRPKGAPSETDSWILRDLARCVHCDAKMGSAYAGPHGPARRHYYRCLKKCRARGARVTTKSFVPVRAADARASELILERLRELRDELARGPEPITHIVDFDAQRAKLSKKRERHIEAHADDLISREELRTQLTKLDGERLRINAEENAARQVNALQSTSARRTALREIKTLAAAWKSASPNGQREIAAQLMTVAHLESPDLVTPTWRPLDSLVTDLGW